MENQGDVVLWVENYLLVVDFLNFDYFLYFLILEKTWCFRKLNFILDIA